MPDTDSSSEESHRENNARRVNDLVMPDTDSDISGDDTHNAPSWPIAPIESQEGLAMPDTDSDYSEVGKTVTRAIIGQCLVDPRLVMPNIDSLSDSSALSESSAASEKHLKTSVQPNLQFCDIDNMSGSELSLLNINSI